MESKSLTNELIDMFDSSPEMPSASAFVQQRSKIKPDAFKTIFKVSPQKSLLKNLIRFVSLQLMAQMFK